MIDLPLFYNISGGLLGILSLLMFTLPSQTGSEGKAYNISKNCLAILILLTSISMFVAQFEKHLAEQQFEKLNALMLLFFFLIGQGIMFSILVLYVSHYAKKEYLYRALLPVLPLFGLYTLIFFFTGDVTVYSFEELFQKLPNEPLLILRCMILIFMTESLIYTLRLCHRAKSEYHQLILCYFSETDFSRSVWLGNLLGYAEALSIWVILTYFYTTPILEVFVGILMIIVFAFYVKEFHYYSKRNELLHPAILLANINYLKTDPIFKEPIDDNFSGISEVETLISVHQKDNSNKEYSKSSEEVIPEVVSTPINIKTHRNPEDKRLLFDDQICIELLDKWLKRDDKPFTKPGITIGDVAKEIGIPKYRLSNLINREKVNFNTWIKMLRIEEASRILIEHPETPISSISINIGFCDLPAFSRAFKKIKGVTPTEYRNKM